MTDIEGLKAALVRVRPEEGDLVVLITEEHPSEAMLQRLHKEWEESGIDIDGPRLIVLSRSVFADLKVVSRAELDRVGVTVPQPT